MPDASSPLAKTAHIHHGKDGTWIHIRDHIITCCVEFYQELYRPRRLQTNTMELHQPHRPAMDDAPPIILPVEVEALIKNLDIARPLVKTTLQVVFYMMMGSGNQPPHLTLQQSLQLCQVPKTWQNAVMILLHKKGNTSDIKNYRPISFLPIIYKVFSHILLQQILWTLPT